MKILKWILITLISLFILLVITALFLPNHYEMSRGILINASAEKIYPYVASPKEWPLWSIWNQRDPHMQITYSGPISGNGAAWEWKSESQGNGGMKFGQAVNNQSIQYELHFEGMGKPSTGAITLTPNGSSTMVTWSMKGTSDENLMMKLMGPLMDKMVGPDFEAGLQNLKKLSEK